MNPTEEPTLEIAPLALLPELVSAPTPWYFNRLLWTLGTGIICLSVLLWAMSRAIGEPADNVLEGEAPKEAAAPAKEAVNGDARKG